MEYDIETCVYVIIKNKLNRDETLSLLEGNLKIPTKPNFKFYSTIILLISYLKIRNILSLK